MVSGPQLKSGLFFSIMAAQLPTRPESCSTPWKVHVVASQYNAALVDGMVSHFEAELRAVCPRASVVVQRVPGSYEIPLAVELIAGRGGADAIAAFGVLLQGATAHAMLVAQSVTDALMRTMIRHKVPVLHEVLLVDNEEQAQVRCLEEELNRGTEAARAAVRMLRAVAEISRDASGRSSD